MESSVSSHPEDYGAAITILTYVFLVVTVSFALVRIFIARRRTRAFGLDDATLLAAITFLLPQSVFVERASSQGLGQAITALTPLQIARSYKWVFASQLLGIIVQFLAKLSIVLLIARLDSRPSTYLCCRLISVVVVVWSLFSIFTIAFQCGFSTPWDPSPGRCAAGGRLWYPILALDTATDSFLAVFFLPTIWKLQLEKSTRRSLTLLFGVRIIVCAAIIGHMVELRPYFTSSDKTYYNTRPTILFQLTLNLSIICSGIPVFYRQLSELPTEPLSSMLSEHELDSASYSLPGSRRNSTKPSNKSSKASSRESSSMSTRLGSQLSSGTRTLLQEASSYKAAMPKIPLRTLAPAQRRRKEQRPFRLIPDMHNGFQTHIYATGSPAASRRRELPLWKGGPWRKSEEEEEVHVMGDDEFAKNMRNAVFQTKEFTMEVEYDVKHHSFRHDQYYGQYTRDESLPW